MLCFVAVDRDSKESNMLRLPAERYSPVRRLSDGLTSIRKYRSHLEKIYNQAVHNQVRSSHRFQT
jgi:serine/threonine-protein kinase SIK3